MRTFFLICIISFFIAFSSGCSLSKADNTIIFPSSDYPWHKSITATKFSIFRSDGKAITAFNDVDAEKENPYYVALPFNPLVYNGDDELLKRSVKNLWIQLINPLNGKSCFAQWEDVGPWFVDDYEYVFSSDGSKRPAAEKYIQDFKGIYLHKTNKTTRKILNKAGIDLSPDTADFLGISGKGIVHWRIVPIISVPSGPWNNNISITPTHYHSPSHAPIFLSRSGDRF